MLAAIDTEAKSRLEALEAQLEVGGAHCITLHWKFGYPQNQFNISPQLQTKMKAASDEAAEARASANKMNEQVKSLET